MMEPKRRKLVSSTPPKYSVDKTKPPISQLSAFCLVHIFQFLPYADKMRIQRVCKTWRDLSKRSWQLERSLTLRDVDWGYTNNRHLSFVTNEILIKILAQCCTNALTRLDFCVSREDPSCTDFLRRFTLHSYCIDIILTFNRLRAVHLTNIQLDFGAFEQLVFELFEIAPIEEFSMGVCPKLGQVVSNTFIGKVKCLRVLSLSLKMVNGGNIQFLSPEKLEVVHYTATFDVNLPDRFFEVHEMFTNLTTISIHLTDKFPYKQFERILDTISANVKTIQVVKLFYTYQYLTPLRFFNNVHELTRLRKLIVVGQHIRGKDTIFSAVGEHCKELTYIELGGMIKVTDQGIEGFAALPKLRELRLSKIYKVTDQSLARMRQLSRLHLYNCPNVKNSGLHELMKLGDLELLDLEFCIRFSLDKFMRAAKKAKADLPPETPMLKVVFRKKGLKTERTTRFSPFLEFKKMRAVPRFIQPHHNHD